jgi:putative oxidoreductase
MKTSIDLTQYSDLALLLLRLLVALIFFTSGFRHAKDPAARSKSIGMSKGFTLFLGIAQILGSVGLALGILTQYAAIGLCLVMLGAMQKKIFVWKTGFWGEKNGGWHYDLLILFANLVIITTGGGMYELVR